MKQFEGKMVAEKKYQFWDRGFWIDCTKTELRFYKRNGFLTRVVEETKR